MVANPPAGARRQAAGRVACAPPEAQPYPPMSIDFATSPRRSGVN